MSTQIYAVLLVKPGHARFDPALGHSRADADDFLARIGHGRHVHGREFGPDEYLAPRAEQLVIQANASGLVAFNLGLGLDMATNGARAKRAAAAGPRLLAVAYNDQVLTDFLTYYEDGVLRRHVMEVDGNEDITLEGELLPEEIDALRASSPHPDCEPEDLTGFEVDGTTYYVEGRLPLYGAGLELARRFLGQRLDEFFPRQGSLYEPKPWWKFW
jgi:hypothetical protein